MELGLIAIQFGRPEHIPLKLAGLILVMVSSILQLKISLLIIMQLLYLITTIPGNTQHPLYTLIVDSGHNSHSLFQLLKKDLLVLTSTLTECTQMDADLPTPMPLSEFS